MIVIVDNFSEIANTNTLKLCHPINHTGPTSSSVKYRRKSDSYQIVPDSRLERDKRCRSTLTIYPAVWDHLRGLCRHQVTRVNEMRRRNWRILNITSHESEIEWILPVPTDIYHYACISLHQSPCISRDSSPSLFLTYPLPPPLPQFLWRMRDTRHDSWACSASLLLSPWSGN